MDNLLQSLLRMIGTDSISSQKILSLICEHTRASAGKWIDHEEQTVAEWGAFPEEHLSAAASNLTLRLSNHHEATLHLLYESEHEYNTACAELNPLLNLIVFIQEKIRLESLLRALSVEGEKLAKKNSQLFEQFLANEKRMKSISRGIIRMQEEERAKLSRELHDSVGQALLAIKIHLDLIATNPSATQDNLAQAGTLTQQTLEEVRHLSRMLRPTMLDDLGLLPTLRSYVKSFSERTGIQIAFRASGLEDRLDPEVETMLFRVTQESLNNILKHSNAKTATIELSGTTSEILLEVMDDGKGFGAIITSELKGSGIRGMRDRVALLGGEFAISSEPQQGTTLRIELPLNKAKRKTLRG